MNQKNLFLLFFLFCGLWTRAQDAPIDSYQDSLQTVIVQAKSKAIKKEALFLLGEHLVQRDPPMAEKIANDLKSKYINTSNYKEVIRNQFIFGASHRWQGDYKTALTYYNQIYTASTKNNDSMDRAKSAQFMGSINMFMGNNVAAQNYLIEASRIYDKIGTTEQKAFVLNSLAGFYLNINQIENGKKSYLKALEQFKVLKDSAGIASATANLGFIYTELNDFKKAEYYLMEQKKHLNVFPTYRELGFHHDFLGLLRQKQGRLQDAYQEHLKALQIREKLSSTYNLCESKLNMGEILIKLNRNQEAIQQLEAVFNFKEHESLNQQQSAYELLAKAYENLGDYKASLTNFKKYKVVNDSIYSEKSLEIIAEKEAQYNQQKKDNEIQLLNKEKEISKQKLKYSKSILIFTVISFGVILIILYIVNALYRKVKSKNKQIENALKDRELLVQETHHRVKNNLQMISSLLNLQSKYVEDKKAFEALQNGRNRVESIAILHKHLYAGENLNLVNVQDYFENLTESIINSYTKNTAQIQLTIQAKNILLDIESLIPIGFIVNELVTNSLKHAVLEEETKTLDIGINLTKNSTSYVLLVTDNGKGYCVDTSDDSKEVTFGTRLIHSFVKKLNATFQTNCEKGTLVEIIIPIPTDSN
jgi:two-component system, sensor histidine kinase PdtaS